MEAFVSGYGSKNTIGRYRISREVYHISEMIESYSIKNPSYLHTYKDLLFAITETDNTAQVYMFKLKDNKYKLIDSIEVLGDILCHITYLPNNKVLIGSCYGDGRVFSIGVDDNGFNEVKSSIKLEGNDEGISRVHCAVSDKNEDNIYVTNIATDKVYRCSITEGKLQIKCYLQLAKGEGPRHVFINEILQLLYIITEYSNKIITVKIENDTLTEINSVSTLPEGFEGNSFCSNFSFSTDLKFVYAANRGANTIAIFNIDSDGLLNKVGESSCYGDWPRHISLLNDRYLYIANRKSNEIVVVKSNKITGLLDEVVDRIKFDSPSFIGFREQV